MDELFQLFFHYLNALWKRRWVALLVAWVVAVPGWMLVASMPSVYKSSSRVYVDTSSVLQPLLRGIAIQSNLGAQVQLMKQTLLSRPNLMEVARKTDYDLTVTSDSQMEALLDSIRSRTSVSSSRENIFAISFEDTDPQRARNVVQTLLTIFVESNLGESRQDLDTAEDFLENQIADYEKRLEEAESRVARYRQDHIDLELGEGDYVNRAVAANNRVDELRQRLNVAVAQRGLLNQELQGIPETLPSELANSGPPDNTQYRIIELEGTLRQLKSKYTDKHPDVVAAQRQLDALLKKQEEELKALEVSGESGPGGPNSEYGVPNPLYSQIKLRLVEVESEIESLRQRLANAQAHADALAAKAEDVPRVQAEYQKLNRDYGIIKARYEELLARRESARMSRSREEVGQEVQYRMIEPAIVPNQPVGPDRPLYLSAVLVFSVAAGVGMAFLLVILDTSFSSMAELRNFTGLPVLGSVTENRKKSSGGFVNFFGLALGFGCLLLIYGSLLVIERQYGLDTVFSSSLNFDALGRSINTVIRSISGLLG